MSIKTQIPPKICLYVGIHVDLLSSKVQMDFTPYVREENIILNLTIMIYVNKYMMN